MNYFEGVETVGRRAAQAGGIALELLFEYLIKMNKLYANSQFLIGDSN